jgi:hypothetical protein
MASIKRRLGVIRDKIVSKELKPLFNDILTELAALRQATNNACLSSAGLAIGGGTKRTAQAATAFMAIADGTPVYKTAATACSALAGTVAQNKFGLWAFYIDSAGTISTSTKTADADTAAAAIALMPAVPSGKAQIGAIVVTTTDAGGFVGATTALDAAGVTVIYINTIGPVADVSASMTA